MAPFAANALIIPTGRAYSGDLTISSGTTTDNATESNITVLSSAGIASTTVASVSGFAAGQYVMIYQAQGTGAGSYEFQLIRSVSGTSLFFYGTLANSYQSTGAEVIKVSEYHNVTLTGGTWTAASWNGTTGGVLVAFLTGGLWLNGGTVSAPSGFRGGAGTSFSGGIGQSAGNQGEGQSGTGGLDNQGANGMGGGAGHLNGVPQQSGGGGGGYATVGGGSSGGTPTASGGNTAGVANLATIFFGGGAGSGGHCCDPSSSAAGASGGGAIFLVFASSTISSGTFSANGGSVGSSDPGGGAGGSIRLLGRLNATLGSSIITSTGGAGHSDGFATGGSGGSGRIAANSAITVSGTTNPSLDTSSTDYVYNVDNTAVVMNMGQSF